MKKEDKNKIIEVLANEISNYAHFYLTDISELNAENTSKLRRTCFDKNVKLIVAKNTLLKLALDKAGKDSSLFTDVLTGATSIMLSDTGNAPGKLIQEFRRTNKKPLLKAAYVEESLYIGDTELDALANLKSRDELIGDIIMLLQSPAKNVISALQSGGQILSGIVKTLSEKSE
ncbi:MAG: 50S ribosomal protein L10 [Bacteroidetes bacterium RIFOXYA12_FULL_35_11]|nr:MAG: 50S ribosomal protein L10 [Bacteroidetes bacterium GWF2_35_48]OFY80385.1 MAG: 50S ribosomal protein L10 [Bacteroidetes bacterium RIFOXYA12_FULL_35_11]OFZ05686.1 MAG: 50S ribosomal protein L10 [Bacteroidetes bacterium RIFOXYC12_FULL_35_7]HBX50778.1 50S ribosomal protein L10 [Bacteroidales bacterium]